MQVEFNSIIATFGEFYSGDLTNSMIENANLNEETIRYTNMKNAQIIHVDLTATTVRASKLSEMYKRPYKPFSFYMLNFSII